MSRTRKIVTAPWRGLKLLAAKFGKLPYRSWLLPRSKFDYLSEVGDGTGSSVVMAPLLWIARTFPEAPVRLSKKLPDGQLERIRDHGMLRVLERPNGYYSGAVLWMATLISWNANGNAYWLKIRNRFQEVVQLWYVPHWLIEPAVDEGSDAYIDSYLYRWDPAGEPMTLRPRDLVHFRFGLDPQDVRKGLSPLASVLREVFTDDEAAAFTASLLRNSGVPGLIVSPEGDHVPSAEDILATKDYLRTQFVGDKRGEPIVMSGPTKVEQFGFSPDQLNLEKLRRIPEERVTAVLGLPAVVAGLGAGLDRSTFTNMGEAREMAYESNIIPTQRLIDEDLRWQLLNEFEGDPFGFIVDRDLTNVNVLQGDRIAAAQRVSLQVRAGLMTRAEGRRELGLTATPEDDVYLLPMNVVAVGLDGNPAVPLESGASETPALRSLMAGVDELLERSNGHVKELTHGS